MHATTIDGVAPRRGTGRALRDRTSALCLERVHLCEEAGAIVTRDPLHQGTSEAAFAYDRLPGPAGRASRHEDPAIERLGAVAEAAPAEDAVCVFTNVDTFADGKRLRKVRTM